MVRFVEISDGFDRKVLATREAEPGRMNAGKAPECVFALADAKLEQVVEIAKAPRYETEASDAEEGIEDLRVNFDPDAARGVDVIAVFTGVKVRRVAHWCGGIAKEEEEHAAPGNDIETVKHNEEAKRCDAELSEGFEADKGSFAPGVFWGKRVAIWIDTVGIRNRCFLVGRSSGGC